jgi:Domain of unknown function (DUF1836).
MRERIQRLQDKLKSVRTVEWDQLPDMDLYMDQVVTYIEGLMGVYSSDDSEARNVTHNMVNNYVKEGYIRRPVNKKYARDQVADLYLMLLLKQVLPIPVLAEGLKMMKTEESLKEGFNRILVLQDDSFKRMVERLEKGFTVHDGDGNSEAKLEPSSVVNFALQLATEANVLRYTSERLLVALASGRDADSVISDPQGTRD